MSSRTGASGEVFAEPRITAEVRSDGTQILRSADPLDSCAPSLAGLLVDGAELHPQRTMIAERAGATGWRSVTWGEALTISDALAQSLLDHDLGPQRPFMILSGNGVDHFLLTLAALSAGVPVMPISPAYSLAARDLTRVRAVAERYHPGAVFAQDGTAFARVLDGLRDLVPVALTSSRATAGRESVDRWAAVTPSADVTDARAALGPDSVAKILFTSGSTGTPKGVINTHRMLCANQQSLGQIWPFLRAEPPVLVDWLPWSHTFGGNHNFNQVLAFGGTLYVDPGSPTPAAFLATVTALREIAPTVSYNVPAGWALLTPALEDDPELRAVFLSRLRLMCYAAAALPEALWDRLRALVTRYAGHEIPLTASWGCTESAPAATSAHFRSAPCGCIGVPMPGVEVKLAPTGAKLEIRLRGPIITPGYLDDRPATLAAFDDEGFYRTGDAVRLVTESDPARGLMFDGRLAEDFKLLTGSWVHVGSMRTRLLSEAGILRDAVICGQDRERIAALAWLDEAAARRTLGRSSAGPEDAAVHEHLGAALARLNHGAGSSRSIHRILLLDQPPSIEAGEITDKGYVNQRAVIGRRAAAVERVYATPPDRDVVQAR